MPAVLPNRRHTPCGPVRIPNPQTPGEDTEPSDRPVKAPGLQHTAQPTGSPYRLGPPTRRSRPKTTAHHQVKLGSGAGPV